MIKNFNEYMNEGVRDLMKGKSDDDILKSLGNLSPQELLFKSCEDGYLEGVKISLKRGVDPSSYGNYAIRTASHNGHFEVVKLLLQDPRVDPTDSDNTALTWAIIYNSVNMIKLLLSDPRVDPSYNNNYAIKWAYSNKSKRVVELLLKDKRVTDKLNDEQIRDYKNLLSGLNESVRNLMKGKDDGEIKEIIYKLPKSERLDKILNKELQNQFTNDELKELIYDLPKSKRLSYVINGRFGHIFTKKELKNFINQYSYHDKINYVDKLKIQDVYTRKEIDDLLEYSVNNIHDEHRDYLILKKIFQFNLTDFYTKEEIINLLDKLLPEYKLEIVLKFMKGYYDDSDIKKLIFKAKDGQSVIPLISDFKLVNLFTQNELKRIINKTRDIEDKLRIMSLYSFLKNVYTNEEKWNFIKDLNDKEKLNIIHEYNLTDIVPKEEMEKLVNKSKGEDSNVEVFNEIIGKTLKSIENKETEMILEFTDGKKYKLCSSDEMSNVTVDDINGDLDDLIGEPLTVAEVVSNVDEMNDDSGTWSFYKFATIKGYVVIRWYGTSNGYYSETVELCEI